MTVINQAKKITWSEWLHLVSSSRPHINELILIHTKNARNYPLNNSEQSALKRYRYILTLKTVSATVFNATSKLGKCHFYPNSRYRTKYYFRYSIIIFFVQKPQKIIILFNGISGKLVRMYALYIIYKYTLNESCANLS